MYNIWQIFRIFEKIEFGGSCGRGDRYGELWQHAWQVCDARSARDDLALTSHDRSGHQLDSHRHPKLMKINEIPLIFIVLSLIFIELHCFSLISIDFYSF